MAKLRIRQAVVVEGRYDKNTLSQLIDAPIFVTNGFGIFRDPEQMELLRLTALRRGLVVLTDSDGAGLVIRNRIKSCIPPEHLLHAYIPDIPGKERRKAAPGREGKLGVEGMEPEVLLSALRSAGVRFEEEASEKAPAEPVTKADLWEWGLSGRRDSGKRRAELKKKLGLPANLSANALLAALNCICTKQELEELLCRPESSTSPSPES